MVFQIQDMISAMQFGGARNSLFQVQITNPVSTTGDQKLMMMAKAASLPEWSLTNVNVAYFGRTFPLPGARKFAPWTVSIYNDEDFVARNALETWSNAINSLNGNIAQSNLTPDYTTQGTVIQFSKTGQSLRTYQFNTMWPSSIGPIRLDWESDNDLEIFDVTFQYSTFQVQDTTTGNPGS